MDTKDIQKATIRALSKQILLHENRIYNIPNMCNSDGMIKESDARAQALEVYRAWDCIDYWTGLLEKYKREEGLL